MTSNDSEPAVMRIAAALERASEHSLGQAVVTHALQAGIVMPHTDSFESLTGMGVVGVVDGRNAIIGNLGLMHQYAVPTSSLEDAAAGAAEKGQTPLWVAIDGSLAGLILVADVVKPTSVGAIRQLGQQGLRVAMLTGDNERTALAIAKQVGIDEVIAGVLPQGKVDAIRKMRTQGRVIAMAGDGVNDAPALAQADIGIAMATGSDVAMAAGDVTLMHSDLASIFAAIHLSRRTMRVIRQNLLWAFAYNVVGIPVAAGVLYRHFGLLLSPVLASAAMALSSVSVVVNSLRLNRLKLVGKWNRFPHSGLHQNMSHIFLLSYDSKRSSLRRVSRAATHFGSQ